MLKVETGHAIKIQVLILANGKGEDTCLKKDWRREAARLPVQGGQPPSSQGSGLPQSAEGLAPGGPWADDPFAQPGGQPGTGG